MKGRLNRKMLVRNLPNFNFSDVTTVRWKVSNVYRSTDGQYTTNGCFQTTGTRGICFYTIRLSRNTLFEFLLTRILIVVWRFPTEDKFVFDDSYSCQLLVALQLPWPTLHPTASPRSENNWHNTFIRFRVMHKTPPIPSYSFYPTYLLP